MADDIQRSLEGMSLHRQHIGSYSSQTANSQSPPIGTMPGYATNNDLQSASARFERFFNNPNLTTSNSPTFADQHSSNSYQHLSPSSFGPSSSAAGLANSGAFGSFGHTFNSGGSSGAFNQIAPANQTAPAMRTRTSTARQGIPSQWNSSPSDELNINGTSPTGGYSGLTIAAQYLSSASASSPSVPSSTSAAAATSSTIPSDDDIIPTAIVVKNIPFSIKREQLLQIIEDLQIPMPYAFNYHFDQGVFRGLAFANFRSGEEADAVVAALNGFDVSGRKLRVEYKKVLQAGEKERIEKEKAIKRMQSMQMEKERERMRRQTGEEWNPSLASNIPSLPSKPVDTDSPYIDYGYIDTGSSGGFLPEAQDEDISADTSDVGNRKEELDLNDSATLEIYSRVLLFKDDRMRDELSFSKNLTIAERRIVHMVSKKLGLYHYSQGEGEDRNVVVTKNEVEKGSKSGRSPASTIGRSNRGENNINNGANNGFLTPGSSHTTGRAGLKTKKSAPDMKRPRDKLEEAGFGGASNNPIFASGASSGSSSNANSINSSIFAAQNGNANMSRKSNGNLRDGYSATTSRRPHSGHSAGGIGGAAGLQSLFASPFDVPPVPSLPINPSDPNLHSLSQSLSQSPLPSPIGGPHSNGGSISSANSQHILRQPAGPGGSNRNFAQRSRVPLHAMQHSSNSGLAELNQNNGNATYAYTGSGGNSGSLGSFSPDNTYGDLDDRFGTLGNLTDDDVRTHETLEV